MSMINDALKKAKKAQKSPPPIPSGGVPRQLGQGRIGKSSETPVLVVITLLVAIAAGALGTTYYLFKRNQTTLTVAASTPANVTPAQSTSQGTAPAAAPASQDATASAAASSPPDGAGAPTTVAPDPNSPLPKLQGVFYSPTRPSAIVNGNTVFVGDQVDGFQVVSITQGNVTITGGGQKHVLTLPP